MPGFVSLQSLVEAIAGSVADAQTLVARGQLEGLAGFLDDEGRPRTLDLRIPSIRPGARPGDEDVYAAPLMALVPHTAMRIRQVEVKFSMELGDLHDEGPAPGETRTGVDPRTATRRSLTVNPAASGAADGRGTTADVTLLVECLDMPEGLARLIDEVVKTQGYRPPGDPGPKSPPPAPPPEPGPDTPPGPRKGDTPSPPPVTPGKGDPPTPSPDAKGKGAPVPDRIPREKPKT
jgi:hypothetical protein